MRWPFLNRWKKPRVLEKPEAKKTRKRHTRARLIDLLCTLKGRPVLPDSSLYGAQFGDCWPSLKRSSMFVGSSGSDMVFWDSFSDLPGHQSSALKDPILTYPTTDFRSGSYYLAARQCDLCPACRNIAIPLSPEHCFTHLGANRMRPSTELANCVSCGSRTPVSLQDEQNIGHFNPTYESVHSDSSDSIYSDIAEDDTFKGQLQVCRPKLVGIRRFFNSQRVGETISGLSPKNNANTHIPADPTYSTVLPSEYETSISTSGSGAILGDPCMSSTLKRGVRLVDDATIYDEVASDFEDGISPFNPPGTKRAARREYTEHMSHLNDQVKRVRREYFVCEE